MRDGFAKVARPEFDRFVHVDGPLEAVDSLEAVELCLFRERRRWVRLHLGVGGALVAFEQDGEFFVRAAA